MKINVMERRGNKLHKVKTIHTLTESYRGLQYAYYGRGRYLVHNHEAEFLSGRGTPFIVIGPAPMDEMGSMTRTRTRTRATRASHGDVGRRRKHFRSYYTVIVPHARRGRTEWHPATRTGPFSVLSRGHFRTQRAAHAWAKKHLKGAHYRLKRVKHVKE